MPFIRDWSVTQCEVFLSRNTSEKSGYVLLAFVRFERFNQNCCNEINR